MGFYEQPGKRYSPSGSGLYTLTTSYVGDVSDLSAFLATKAKGTLQETGFYIESVEVVSGFADDTVGDVTVIIHAAGQIATYSTDQIISGGETSRSVVVYKDGFAYRLDYTAPIRSVEYTAGSAPTGDGGKSGASGIASAGDPVVYAVTPVRNTDDKIGPLLLPSNFSDTNEYNIDEVWDGYSFTSLSAGTGLVYRITQTFTKILIPVP